jgi:autotransporter-associated beta strand protein
VVTVSPAWAAWTGAVTGTTNDAAHTYTNTTNWAGGTIDDSFAGVTLTGTTTLYFGADHSTVAAGFNFAYGGNFDLSLQSSSTTARLITLNGNIGGDFGGSNDRTLNLGSTTNALNLNLNGATRTFAVTDSGDILNVVNVVSNSTGTAGIDKTGAGRLNLSGANTYNGNTTVSGGIVRLGSSSVVTAGSITSGPIGTGALSMANGTTLQDNGSARTIANAATFTGTVTFSSSGTGSLVLDGTTLSTPATITLGGTSVLTVNNTTTFRNPVTASTFTKNGTGTLVLDADNAGSLAGVTVSAGVLRFDRSTAIPGASGRTVTVAAGGAAGTGATLTFDQAFVDRVATSSAGSLVFPGNSSAALDLSAIPLARLGSTGTATYNGALTIAGSTYRLGGGGGSFTYGSLLSGAVSVDINNGGQTAGFVTLSNSANDFTGGIVVDAGTLNLDTADGVAGGASKLGRVPLTPAANLALSNGGTLRVGAAGATINPNRSITVGTGGGGFDTNGNAISVGSTIIGGANTLTKVGAGTLTLAGTVTAGTISVVGGATSEVVVGATGNVTADSLIVGNNGSSGKLSVAAGGSFTVNGGSTASLIVGTASGSAGGTFSGTLDLSATNSFTANVGEFRVGTSTSNNGTGDLIGVVTLSPDANITASGGTFIADSSGFGNATRTSNLRFGNGNSTLTTPNLVVGNRKSLALLDIAPGGVLTIASGTATPTSLTVSLQDAGSGTFATGHLNTTGGTLVGTFGTITLGDKGNGAGTGTATGTMTLGTSADNNVAATGVVIGRKTGGSGNGIGTLNTGGGVFTVGSGGITDGGGTSTLNLVGPGIVAMLGSNVGAAGVPIDTFNFTGGTLRNAGTVHQAVNQNGATTRLEVTAAHPAAGTTVSGNYTVTGGTTAVALAKSLTVTGAMAFDATAGGTYEVGLNAVSAGTLAVTGTIGLTSSADVLSLVATDEIVSGSYTIATHAGYAAGDADFETILVNGITAQSTNPALPNYVQVTYNPTNIQLSVANIGVIPEPTSIGVVLLSAAGLLGRRRRRGV